MKEELERTKAALKIATDHLEEKTDITHTKCLEQINSILNPAPIMEDVEEIVGWANVYPDQNGDGYVTSMYKRKEHADKNAAPGRVSCQPIKVTVQREKKQPVERSVTVRAHITDGNHGGFYEEGHVVTPDCKRNVFANHPEVFNQSVLLTATWTEEP